MERHLAEKLMDPPQAAQARVTRGADWRDEIITSARQPWQPTPIQSTDPGVLPPPDAAIPGPGIEPGR